MIDFAIGSVAYLLVGSIFAIALLSFESKELEEEDKLTFGDLFEIIATWPLILFYILFKGR